ncbi:uncharacterized protein LOC131844732 [Achroia grisella]|uniref:uncharacterized protein LOC131844732 n=1 Tax=Achroia grisella TaxID=688607 RepID=UPI0027D1FCC5|nr:uncharacterized protein LOC131844732 [Achroia grisella]
MSRWTEHDTIQLIELYKTFPYLWDTRNKLYKSMVARNCAYEQILRKMDDPELTISDIKKKIKNLRSCYYQELRKVHKYKLEGRAYTPVMVWFTKFQEVMQAVHKAYYEEESGSESEGVSLEYNLDEDKDEYVVSIKQEFIDEIKKEEETCAPTDYEYNKTPVKLYKTSLKRKERTDVPVVSVPQVKVKKPDEFQLFADKMAEQLRNMPLDKALELQIEVQTLVAKERLDFCKDEDESNMDMEQN